MVTAGTPYLALFQALDLGGVRYAVAGGLAVVLHGVPRMTFDVDLLLDWAPDNVQRLVGVLRAEGYRPRVPEPVERLLDPAARGSWRRDRGMLAFSLHHPGRPMGTPRSWRPTMGSESVATPPGPNDGGEAPPLSQNDRFKLMSAAQRFDWWVGMLQLSFALTPPEVRARWRKDHR